MYNLKTYWCGETGGPSGRVPWAIPRLIQQRLENPRVEGVDALNAVRQYRGDKEDSGSTDVIVDVAAMERPHGTKMEDWQLGDLVSPDASAGGTVVHEALQQSINRYALPLGFLPDSSFGLWRDVETHAKSSLLGIAVLSYAPLTALLSASRPYVSSYISDRILGRLRWLSLYSQWAHG